MSADTEYWCPMCPGVVSDWPTKCPVCNMALVRREKGEMTPLPDGVVARVQLSPYRLQLAGHSHVAGRVPCGWSTRSRAGRLDSKPESLGSSSSLVMTADVFERDAAVLAVGQEGQVACDAFPGETFPAASPSCRRRPSPRRAGGCGSAWKTRAANCGPGSIAAAKFRIPVAQLDCPAARGTRRWRDARQSPPASPR